MSIEKQTVELLKSKKLKLATAESCTGGLISKRITDVSGSSEVFEALSVIQTVSKKMCSAFPQKP